MIPSQVAYTKPNTLKEALELIAELGDECKVLAGGHSLIPVMRLRLNDPETLIDISQLEELKGIRDNENSITIGACATHGDISKNEALKKYAPLITIGASHVGDRQVKNFGTIGGSIAHADPAADWPGILLAADAKIIIQNAERKREVDIDQFFKGLFMTAVEDGELITAIRIPKTDFNANSTYVKFDQPASRFALVGCAVAMAPGGKARVAFNGVASKPFRDKNIETALNGKTLSEDTIQTATQNVADGVNVMSDHFASSVYRKQMAAVYARRALQSLM